MRFVPATSVEQQDIQLLHRERSRLVSCRTQLANRIRGLLMEYGGVDNATCTTMQSCKFSVTAACMFVLKT